MRDLKHIQKNKLPKRIASVLVVLVMILGSATAAFAAPGGPGGPGGSGRPGDPWSGDGNPWAGGSDWAGGSSWSGGMTQEEFDEIYNWFYQWTMDPWADWSSGSSTWDEFFRYLEQNDAYEYYEQIERQDTSEPDRTVATDLSLMINGQQLWFPEEYGTPYIDANNRTMVPVRLPMEAIGCEVGWDNDTQTVTVSNDGTVVQLTIGSNIITINGEEKEIDTTPIIQNDRTYLPIRAVLEAFGSGVYWLGDTNTVDIYTAAYMASAGSNLLNSQDTIDHVTNAKTINWTYNGRTYSFTAPYSDNIYSRYLKMTHRIATAFDYKNYVYGFDDEDVVAQLVAYVKAASPNASDYELLNILLACVQSLPYVTDDVWTNDLLPEYPKYPYETLYDGCGDCEDTSVLMVSLIKELGYGSALIEFNDHMGAGVAGGDGLSGAYFEKDGVKYYYLETTSEGWRLGEVPEGYSTAYVLVTE